MLTLEERERRAYIEGRVEEAAVLGEAVDAINDRVLDLDFEVRSLKDEIEKLEEELAEAQQ